MLRSIVTAPADSAMMVPMLAALLVHMRGREMGIFRFTVNAVRSIRSSLKAIHLYQMSTLCTLLISENTLSRSLGVELLLSYTVIVIIIIRVKRGSKKKKSLGRRSRVICISGPLSSVFVSSSFVNCIQFTLGILL
jgi:hypothetical protein